MSRQRRSRRTRTRWPLFRPAQRTLTSPTLPVVIGYADAQPDQFEVAPVPQIEPALEGISVAKSTDPTVAHSPIYDAVKTALLAMMSDGSYQAILTKYQVEAGRNHG